MAYFAFDGGPRLCIGNKLPLLKGALMLAMLALYYDFQMVPDHEMEGTSTVSLFV